MENFQWLIGESKRVRRRSSRETNRPGNGCVSPGARYQGLGCAAPDFTSEIHLLVGLFGKWKKTVLGYSAGERSELPQHSIMCGR